MSPDVPGLRAVAPYPTPPAPNPKRGSKITEADIRKDFRLFLVLVWRFLLGTDPAPIMLDMAYWLQHGPDRIIIMAFRGFSKSWITGAYALWLLWCDPEHKVMVVSGSLTRAIATTNWCLSLIREMPLLAKLKPGPDQRQSSKMFDVGPATPSQSASFFALGIGGQSAGFRANTIVADDVETQQNSLTPVMREKNREAVKEFDSIVLPGGRVIYLGTPHDQESLYNSLEATKVYKVRIWPAEYPTRERMEKYGPRLAPYVRRKMEELGPACVGMSTMPSRFTESDLAKRKLSLGLSEYTLQFLLDTSLSDRDKYPLRLSDLMVMPLDPRNGPDVVVWSNDSQSRLSDLPLRGFSGDFFHRPLVPPNTAYREWNVVVAGVDNSGRGEDESALAIVAELNGNLFLLHVDATKAGFEPDTLRRFAKALVKYRVGRVLIEENFGGGMFAALFKPYIQKAWEEWNKSSAGSKAPGGTEVVEVRASNTNSKERRILSLLEPVTQGHRLVVNREVVEWDTSSLSHISGTENREAYSLWYQYTRLMRVRDCLSHDDRLEAVAIALSDFSEVLALDPAVVSQSRAVEDAEAEWERLMGSDEETTGRTLLPNKTYGPSTKRAKGTLPQQRN